MRSGGKGSLDILIFRGVLFFVEVLGVDAVMQTLAELLGRDAALVRGQVGAGLPSGRWAPNAGTKKNLRTTKMSAMAPTLSRFSTADSWPTTMWRAMA